MTVLDPYMYLSDPQVKPFARQTRVDLTALDVPIKESGVYIVYENTVKNGQVEVVRNIVPLAYERTAPGQPTEGFQLLDPRVCDGQFAFNPLVNTQTTLVLSLDLNAPQSALSASLSNTNRIKKSGITSISSNPWVDATRWNPLFTFALMSESTLQVTFQILPAATTDPMPNLYAVPTAAAPTPDRRVDFAGVIVMGVVMPQNLYTSMMRTVQQGAN